MIQSVTPILYANRLKETRKVLLSEDQKLYYELGLDNQFYKAVYAFILAKHFGVDCPEICKIQKDDITVYCQQTFSNWEEFDFSLKFRFNKSKEVSNLQKPIRLIRLALFDEQFMVKRKKNKGYDLALVNEDKPRILSKDFNQILSSDFDKTDPIYKSVLFKNILQHFSLEEIIQEVDDYFSLQDELIEEKILLLSAYLKESKYKELFLGFLNNKGRNESIRNQLIKNLYLIKR